MVLNIGFTVLLKYAHKNKIEYQNETQSILIWIQVCLIFITNKFKEALR